MGRRIKKPPVKMKERHDWLQRSKQGESSPQIAKKDGFDVRTVRKQIALAQQEEEVHEARVTVLKDAITSHHKDITSFVEQLASEVVSEKSISQAMKDNPMWLAFREHIPRSPLWKYFERFEDKLEEITVSKNDFISTIHDEIHSNPELLRMINSDEKTVANISNALLFQAEAQATKQTVLNIEKNLEAETSSGETGSIRYGAFYIGVIKEAHLPQFKNSLKKLEVALIELEEYKSLEKNLVELKRLKTTLQSELQIIILRRIVPGRCRFCAI
ncbi:hypothetical protein ACFLW0_02545 [Chloroflexota bacterium]